eukprot:CAMPEP_0117661480 /NCGR_PEP_ID=MMETSP0804-20121206/7558_1 /TAXON_ID=1074897 /ORGANISM="Tetraselmis astigmatica, Strain CCMP880" /LENGTH=145 /DNA_ID=CAMNT_0005468347 /DNA_START=947 /DNA_END=1384 /DNA_ORIENTATION=-
MLLEDLRRVLDMRCTYSLTGAKLKKRPEPPAPWTAGWRAAPTSWLAAVTEEASLGAENTVASRLTSRSSRPASDSRGVLGLLSSAHPSWLAARRKGLLPSSSLAGPPALWGVDCAEDPGEWIPRRRSGLPDSELNLESVPGPDPA